ncbi:MAG: FGGY-family carbohydrate kinase, partial [Candidatus Margulisiibacteriota bacterium]
YLFGTVDTWILWNLTGVHATEPSNASRTMLLNLQSKQFDPELTSFFGIPMALLPQLKESQGIFGNCHTSILGREIPVTGILGDQQAALFAHRCWEEGEVKNTYGTGLFLVANTKTMIVKDPRLVATLAWTRNGQTDYAVEGSVFTGGSLIQWLRDSLHFFENAKDSEALARSVESSDGVVLVPAFNGLGAPYWDSQARGLMIGLTRGTQPAHMTRAALEAIAYQTTDVVDTLRDTMRPRRLLADGGATANGLLMQFQADMLDMPVLVATAGEMTGLGAAGIAGIGAGFWSDKQFLDLPIAYKTYRPNTNSAEREARLTRWRDAVSRCRNWSGL